MVTAAEIEDEGDFIQSLEVFPNPSNGIFKTRVRLSKEAEIVFRVLNMQTGNTEKEYVSRAKTTHLQNFNIQGIAPGIYLLIIDTKYGNALRKIDEQTIYIYIL